MNLTLLALAVNCKQVDLKAGGGAVAHGKCPPPDQAVQFEPWPQNVFCILGKDTKLYQCLSSPWCIDQNWQI